MVNDQEQPRRYQVTQLGPPNQQRIQTNIPVADLESIVTHHPGSNRNATMVGGVLLNV